jgi:type II secretory ATPase GspE/PulE/Tfp pilus assembly ATPase PilB-like protein
MDPLQEKQKRRLDLLLRKEEEESVKILAEKYHLSPADLSAVPIEIDAIRLVNEEQARKAELVVFQSTGKNLTAGVRNPEKNETKALLKRLAEERYNITLFLVSRSSLEHAWTFYRKVPEAHISETGTLRIGPEKRRLFENGIRTLAILRERTGVLFSPKTSELLEIILAGGLALEASDIHIEPAESSARIRFRIDGVLADIGELSIGVYRLLLSRVKLVSELKLNIHDKNQDGRFTISAGGSAPDIEVRTSTLPGPHGENIVMRILNPRTLNVPFEDLGMQPWSIELIEKELARPNGMILTTGPTGSGKTTTLYTFLKKVNTPGIKIITIEDPIEYLLKGIEQTQVDKEKGYDFSNGLRAIVRQDPDIILIGEIRDLETAETAMHAALTGHLVFSTLHTNDAAGTIPRLIDLGVKPSIIAPAINISMAQRLVRKLCPTCRLPLTITQKERTTIQKELAAFPKNVPLPDPDTWTLFSPLEKDCPSCFGMGYKGRIGIYELLLIDEVVEKLILKEPSEYELKREAQRQNQITMRQDGILKILAGITDWDEVNRVAGR